MARALFRMPVACGGVGKPEDRNPKEIRMPKSEIAIHAPSHSFGVADAILRGLWLSAQDCEERSTLGGWSTSLFNPEGGMASRGSLCSRADASYNPLRVGDVCGTKPRVVASRQPWAERWNP